MNKTLDDAIALVKMYNERYGTAFLPTSPWRLYPGLDGNCEFRDQSWPCCEKAGVYLILSEDNEVIYVGQSLCFGSRFYQYFQDDNGTCVVRSPYWTKKPHALVALEAPKDRKYERLSLEEFLIQRLQPVDNTIGK